MYLQLLGMFALCALEYDQDMLSHDHLGKVDNRSYLPTPSASVWGYLLGPATDPSMVSGLVPTRARQYRDLSALWFEAILAQEFATEETGHPVVFQIAQVGTEKKSKIEQLCVLWNDCDR